MCLISSLTAISRILCALLFFITLSAVVSFSQSIDTVTIKQALIIKAPPAGTEMIAPRDPIALAIVTGTWRTPKEGDTLRYAGDTVASGWKSYSADDKGWFNQEILNRAYVYCAVSSDSKKSMLLRGMGNSMVYVNGSPRSGNPYGVKDTYESWEPKFNYSLIPIELRKGRNDFLFYCVRGTFKASLIQPRALVQFNGKDGTMPDIVRNRHADLIGAIGVINSSPELVKRVYIEQKDGRGNTTRDPAFGIQPLSITKIRFGIPDVVPDSADTLHLSLSLMMEKDGGNVLLDTTSVDVGIVSADQCRKETFISSIDGSVQYYAVNPQIHPDSTHPAALFLSLHGAGVEAIGQAMAYGSKPWGMIVAPTNRRPFGFNWEDWGRLDALEVLNVVKARYSIDENRVYLTGHSMGGHGTYHLGVNYPDQFAAIGPSAGWISFWSYGRNEIVAPSPMQDMLMRASLPSRTDSLLSNVKQEGVYILQGSVDDNVPPQQARSMAETLGKFHKDFVYYEQAGAGHWWDNSREPGADCVDWPPMFDFFARHARPAASDIRQVDFVTACPGVSSQDYWLRVEAQQEQFKLSSASIRFDPGLHCFTGTTSNIQRMGFDCAALRLTDTASFEIDGQKIPIQKFSGNTLWLARSGSRWSVVDKAPSGVKNSRRYGSFRDVFRNNVVFVYGTHGNIGENRWSFEKARYDAERLWYQGNADIDVAADVDFHPLEAAGRNVVLYGNENTNSVWQKVLARCPVEISRGKIVIGDRKFRGDNLSCVFIYPRSGSDSASVGVISGTGMEGMRLTDRMLYLQPGIAFPDCVIAGTGILTDGDAAALGAGFFGLDWTAGNGEWCWSK